MFRMRQLFKARLATSDAVRRQEGILSSRISALGMQAGVCGSFRSQQSWLVSSTVVDARSYYGFDYDLGRDRLGWRRSLNANPEPGGQKSVKKLPPDFFK